MIDLSLLVKIGVFKFIDYSVLSHSSKKCDNSF